MAHIRTSSMRHDGVEGHKIVEVTIMGSDNFTANMVKRSIELDMIDGYEKIFTSSFPILRVTIKALRPLMDRLGNDSTGVVYSTELRQNIASRVNWKNKISIDFTKFGKLTSCIMGSGNIRPGLYSDSNHLTGPLQTLVRNAA